MVIPSSSEMLAQLIATPSISSVNPAFDSSNLAVIERLAEWAEALGFVCQIMPLPDDPGKANLVATLGDGEGGLVLSGHSDTVPCDPDKWRGDPFVARFEEGRVYGLGSCDMKGFFVAALCAAQRFSATKLTAPLHIVATADEESTMNGAKQLVRDDLLQARYAVIGEPTGLTPIRLHKGITMQQLRIVGRSGHSSDPALGRSALEGMTAAMNMLMAWRSEIQQRFPHGGFEVPFPTLNLGHIRGGDNPNRICGDCTLHFDLRSVPQMAWSQLEGELRGRLDEALAGRELSWSLESLDVEVPPFETAADAALVRCVEALSGQPSRSVAFASEAPFFQQAGLETVLLGPGDIAVAHRPEENLALAELERADKLLEQLIHRVCVVGSLN